MTTVVSVKHPSGKVQVGTVLRGTLTIPERSHDSQYSVGGFEGSGGKIIYDGGKAGAGR